MSIVEQKGEQYKSKIKVGSLDEAYLKKDELMATCKAIMNYKLRDPLPSVYTKQQKAVKEKALKKNLKSKI